MDHLLKELQEVGLSEKEARVYLASLELGEATAQQIAAKALVNRPTAYMMIESLTQRGLMSSIMGGKKRLFSAEHPGRLVEYFEDREDEMHKKLKNLREKISGIEDKITFHRPLVRVVEGKQALKIITQDIKESESDEMVEIVDFDALYKALSPDDLKNLRGALLKKNMKRKCIYSGKPITNTPTDIDRFFLPEELSGFKSNIGIYGNKIVMVTFDEKMYSLIIESPILTKTLKILFKLAIHEANTRPTHPILDG